MTAVVASTPTRTVSEVDHVQQQEDLDAVPVDTNMKGEVEATAEEETVPTPINTNCVFDQQALANFSALEQLLKGVQQDEGREEWHTTTAAAANLRQWVAKWVKQAQQRADAQQLTITRLAKDVKQREVEWFADKRRLQLDLASREETIHDLQDEVAQAREHHAGAASAASTKKETNNSKHKKGQSSNNKESRVRCESSSESCAKEGSRDASSGSTSTTATEPSEVRPSNSPRRLVAANADVETTGANSGLTRQHSSTTTTAAALLQRYGSYRKTNTNNNHNNNGNAKRNKKKDKNDEQHQEEEDDDETDEQQRGADAEERSSRFRLVSSTSCVVSTVAQRNGAKQKAAAQAPTVASPIGRAASTATTTTKAGTVLFHDGASYNSSSHVITVGSHPPLREFLRCPSKDWPMLVARVYAKQFAASATRFAVCANVYAQSVSSDVWCMCKDKCGVIWNKKREESEKEKRTEKKKRVFWAPMRHMSDSDILTQYHVPIRCAATSFVSVAVTAMLLRQGRDKNRIVIVASS